MDGHIVGSMISANSITGEQIQANSIKTANLELSAQQKIQNATDEETVKALIKADLDGFQVNVSNTYETKETVTTKVNNAVNNIQVGSRNLWVVSDLINGYEEPNYGYISESTECYKTRRTLIETNGATSLVYQCWNPNGVVNESNSNRVAFFDSEQVFIADRQIIMLDGSKHQTMLIEIPSNVVYVRLGAICGGSDGGYDISIKVKFELGNKPTRFCIRNLSIKTCWDCPRHTCRTCFSCNRSS